MAEKERHGNYSLPVDRAEWLKQKKKETGLPESHFVNKGLDLQIGIEEFNLIKSALTPTICFFLGTILFAFGIYYSAVIPSHVLVIIFLASIITVLIAWMGIYKTISIWRKIKKVGCENEIKNRKET